MRKKGGRIKSREKGEGLEWRKGKGSGWEKRGPLRVGKRGKG